MKDQEQAQRLVQAGKQSRFRKGQSGNPLGRPSLPDNLPLREVLVRSAPATLAALRAVARTAHEQARKADGRDAAALLKVSSDCLTTLAGYELGKPWEGNLEELETRVRKRSQGRLQSPSRMPGLAPAPEASASQPAPSAPAAPADNTHYVNLVGSDQPQEASPPSPSAGPPPLEQGEEEEVI
jgi:hypothetical protein